MKNLEVIDLGVKDYLETLDLQYEFVNKRINKEIPDTLIFVEHPHVVTLGRKANPENIIDKTLTTYQVERGGDVTYHGPGQIVGYPIIDYSEKKDIGKFLRNIEQVLIETLKLYNVESLRKEKYTGVWLPSDKKIASIGVSFKNWVSYHGFSLNVYTDLDYFYKINPCGLESSVMINLQDLVTDKVNISKIKTDIANNFLMIFND